MTPAEIQSCEDALRVLAAHLDGELEHEVGAQVEHHLAKCRSCFSRSEFEKRLKGRIAESGRADVRPELRTRVQQLIERFSVAGRDSGSE